MYGYCKLQEWPVVTIVSIPEGQVYSERMNTRKRKFFKQMWSISSLCGAASRIERSDKSQTRSSQNVRNMRKFLIKG